MFFVCLFAGMDTVIVALFGVGKVPVLKQSKVAMPREKTMDELSRFIRAKLKIPASDNLVC